LRLHTLKRLFVGNPLPTAQARHERLSKVTGLAIFASDNLSSVAYATEEILRVLILAGPAALGFSVPIGLAITAVIVIVISSYRQTIFAYPQGASDYIVAKDNLGIYPGLTAGSALLIDYTLTVAVSVSAGVAAVTSAFPFLYPQRILLGVLCVAGLAVANLRGVRETGRLFALPTYLFIAGFLGLIAVGFLRYLWEGPPAVTAPPLPTAPPMPPSVPLENIPRPASEGETPMPITLEQLPGAPAPMPSASPALGTAKVPALDLRNAPKPPVGKKYDGFDPYKESVE